MVGIKTNGEIQYPSGLEELSMHPTISIFLVIFLMYQGLSAIFAIYHEDTDRYSGGYWAVFFHLLYIYGMCQVSYYLGTLN